MSTRLHRWRYRLQGRGSLYQYYATIHPETCEVCLRRHGEIYGDVPQEERPPLHPECRCALLEFPVEDLKRHEERGVRMKEKARRELLRRELFRRASAALERADHEEALSLFRETAQIELYASEIERLCAESGEALQRSPDVAEALRDLFLKAYRWKFDLEKYQQMPEGMRSAREAHGLSAIRAAFEPFLTSPREP
jgi:hypothetical protein